MIVVNINNIGAKVRATPLTGLSVASGGVIVDTDTVLQAFGKIQNQITNIPIVSPGGSDRQVQWNNNGVFGGAPEMTWFPTNRLSLGYITPVDAGYRLDVNGNVRFTGTNTGNSAVKSFIVETSDNLENFSIEASGRVFLGGTGLSINRAAGQNDNVATIVIGTRNYLANVPPQQISTIVGGAATVGTSNGELTLFGAASSIGNSCSGAIALGARVRIGANSPHSIGIGDRVEIHANNPNVAVFSGYLNDTFHPINHFYLGGMPDPTNTSGSTVGTDGWDIVIHGASGRGRGDFVASRNKNGGNLIFAGGRPTGDGIAGDLIFQTSQSGVANTGVNSLTNRWAIKGETGHLQALGAFNILLDTTTGSKIGGTGAKLALYDNTPIAQPTTAVAAATYVNNAGTSITDTDTFDGYTLGQVVKALRDLGALT